MGPAGQCQGPHGGKDGPGVISVELEGLLTSNVACRWSMKCRMMGKRHDLQGVKVKGQGRNVT